MAKQPKQYHTHKLPMERISLSIAPELLKIIDQAATKDYTTRSDIIRMAVLWYLRPQGRELDQADPDAVLKTLQHRKSRADIKKMLDDIDKFDDA